jgi:hypothetical protein
LDFSKKCCFAFTSERLRAIGWEVKLEELFTISQHKTLGLVGFLGLGLGNIGWSAENSSVKWHVKDARHGQMRLEGLYGREPRVKLIEIRTSKSLMGTLVSASAKQGLCRFVG